MWPDKGMARVWPGGWKWLDQKCNWQKGLTLELGLERGEGWAPKQRGTQTCSQLTAPSSSAKLPFQVTPLLQETLQRGARLVLLGILI